MVAPIQSGGYRRPRAWRVTTADEAVFVKEAEDEGSLHVLRREALVYREVRRPFLPAFVGFADSGRGRASRSSASKTHTGLRPIPTT